MERVGDIIARQTPEPSNRPAASEEEKLETRLYTSKDVMDGLLTCEKEVPKPETCKFCGAHLYHEAITMGKRVFVFHPFPQRCTCERAQAYWQKHDAEEARKRAEEEEREARERRRAKIERLLGKSGIKKRFQQRTFANFIQDTPERRRCYGIAKNYADRFPYYAAKGEGLYIEGSNGTGKTHLAAAIALQLIAEGIPVVCKTASDLLGDIKRGFDNGEVSEYEVLRAYKEADLLVVDDLGKEQCTDWSMSTLYSILNDRYEDMKPTIITTNYNAEDLLKALTPRGFDDTKIRAIISRLREVSNVVTMAWEDFRSR